MFRLSARIERFETARPFVIARGEKTHVDVVLCEASLGGAAGRGEGTAIYYRGDTAETAVAAVKALGAVADRAELQVALHAGAARNAADCAVWAAEARAAGEPVWRLAGLPPPLPVTTAMTIGLAEPGVMAAAARAAGARPLLKIKLGGDGGDRARVAAVRRSAPRATLIADANEAWGALDIEAEAAALAGCGVALIEQPVPAGQEALLDTLRSAVPLCADESCHTRADLDRVAGRFGLVNIKLDKAGGLTEALALAAEARARGLGVMVGCMLSTSLGIAPAVLAAQGAAYADLDGPRWLKHDRAPGLRFDEGGKVWPDEGSLCG